MYVPSFKVPPTSSLSSLPALGLGFSLFLGAMSGEELQLVIERPPPRRGSTLKDDPPATTAQATASVERAVQDVMEKGHED